MAAVAQSQAPQSVFPKSHVGFDSITQQIEKKLLKRGFQFNVICVGTLALSSSITCALPDPRPPQDKPVSANPPSSTPCSLLT